MAEEMKNSGIEWIGDIPLGWIVAPLKYLLTEEADNIKVGPFGSQLSGNDFVEDGYWVYNQRSVIDNNFDYNDTCISKEKYNLMKGFQVRENDILITTRGTIGRICRIPSNYHSGIIHPCIIKFRIDENKILYSLLELIFNHSDIIKTQLSYKSNATTIDVIYGETLKNIILPLQSISEQEKIADFLNKKCTEIDSLSSDIQSQISILEDYKKSVITETVTKGLNPDVEMKDSGIEWIGNIPKEWNIRPLYYYFEERKNKNLLGKEDNLLSLSYGNIIRKNINTNMGLLPESFNTYNIIEKNDIIIRPTDLQNDKRSLRTGISREHGIITSAYIALKAIKPSNAKYYHYLLHAYDIQKVFYNMGNGVRQGLNFSEFSKLMILEPNMTEQNQIVEYLDSKCNEIDIIIDGKKKQLEVLEQYKKSLIYEYVTGKKEVLTND